MTAGRKKPVSATPKEMEWAQMACHRCLVYLGDLGKCVLTWHFIKSASQISVWQCDMFTWSEIKLFNVYEARYQNELAGVEAEQLAERFYHQALSVAPHVGERVHASHILRKTPFPGAGEHAFYDFYLLNSES